jgi:hypothetical protein
MKGWKAWMWVVAGGLPLGAATIWNPTPTRPPAPDDSIPQVALADVLPDAAGDPAPATEPAGQPANPVFQRRPWMDFLRRESLSPQEEAEDWAKVIEFVRINSPNRYLLLVRQSPQAGSSTRLRLLQRWQNLEQQQRNQPALYEIHLQQFKEEDVLIGLVAQLRQARNHGNIGRVQEMRSQITAEAVKLVDLNLRDRAVRIQNAEDLLSQERARLEKDMLNKDQLAQERANAILQQAERTRPMPFGPRDQ